MNFSRELYSPELLDEMWPLWKSHDAEVPGIGKMPLDPDLTVYERMAEAGMLRIFTVRDEMGRLHGYQVMMVSAHPHSRNSLQAVQDILYICPEARKGLLGYQFVRWCADRLKDEGVKVVYQYISANNNFSPLMKRAGYKLTDLAFARVLN